MTYLHQLPFTYTGTAMVHEEHFAFYHVEFTQDWGIFKKGEKYDSVDIDAEDGELRAFDEDEQQVAMQEIVITMTPKN